MKKIIVVIILIITLIGCKIEREVGWKPYDHVCIRPTEVPDTMIGGTPIYWDCDWNSSYLDKRVTIKRDSAGGVIAISRILLK